MKTGHPNPRLPDMRLDERIEVTNRIAAAASADIILIATPAQNLREAAILLAPLLKQATPVIACAKGIERGTHKFLTEVIAEAAPNAAPAILSGPSFAEDVARGLPTAVLLDGDLNVIERTDLRVAAKGAVFEVSEAKRWLLGGYNHGHLANLPYPIAMEMALGFRFTAERFYEIGFLNRLVEADQLIPSALAMAEHLLTLPPASRVNTVHMMRQMRPTPTPEQQRLAAELREHGAKSDLMESRAAFAEKRAPNFKGWDNPEDRYRLPSLDTVKS